jgi:hypothetical protein|tara:strand:- start:1728 stop:2360 length:633 start_codon:yes stop_codon:yes gene_type:complete
VAITTYAQLQTATANWLDRTDLTARIPEFIELAEANFNRVIRQPDMVTKNDSFSIAGRYTTLPTDTLEIVRIVVDLTPVIVLEYLTPEEISERRISMSATGKPYYFTVIGGSSNQLEVVPSPDATYTSSIVYYTRIPALTDSATTNWLLTAHPDIYLFGTLVEAEPYLKNDERMPMWTSRLDKALMALRLQGERELHTGSSLRMRARVLG